MDLESIKTLFSDLMSEGDPAALLPDLNTVVGKVELVVRIAVMVGPLVLLVLGLWYLFLPPKEANHTFGYRFYWGMGSVEAWRYTQKIAGLAWTGLGAILTIVMFFISNGFHGQQTMDMVTSAAACIVWEVILIALSCLVINVIVMVFYDRNGNRRKLRK